MPPAGEEPALVRLYSNKKEREAFENFADLFAILKTTEKLERAYVRDAISAKDYEPGCQKLIGQFKTLWESLRDEVPNVEHFLSTYSMQCPMAAKRLIHSGIPATLEHGQARSSQAANAARSIADTVQCFITAMDSLKLGMSAVDEIHPLLTDLLNSLHKVTQLPPQLTGKVKTKEWMAKLHGMPASKKLSEDDVRQLMFDLESSYNEFMSKLNETN